MSLRCGDPNNPGGPGHKQNGDPCGAQVVPGTYRCALHGGLTPAAKVKAETALALLRMPAIEALHKVIAALEDKLEQFNQNVCTACGYPKGNTSSLVKVCRGLENACVKVLDRTGLGPRATLEISQSDGNIDPKALTPDELGRMLSLLAQVKALKEEIRLRLHGAAFGTTLPPSSQETTH